MLLRLPHELKQVFADWLTAHHPLRAGHVMSLVRQMRGGRENDTAFGARQRGTGIHAELLRQRFVKAGRRFGLADGLPPLDLARFRPPAPADAPQLSSRSPGRPKNDLAPTGGGSGAFSEPGAQLTLF